MLDEEVQVLMKVSEGCDRLNYVELNDNSLETSLLSLRLCETFQIWLKKA